MKFRKNQKLITMPPMGSLESVALVTPEGHQVILGVMHIDDLVKERKRNPEARAWPMYVALAMGAYELHLWPVPHKAGELKIRYYPPMEEI